MAAAQKVLVTIPASHYCEKARWALQAARIPFREDGFAPIISWASTIPKGGKSVPLLIQPGGGPTLTDSSDILEDCAKSIPWLFPNEKSKNLEKHFSDHFGPHARRLAYFNIFQNYKTAERLIIGPLEGRISPTITRWILPLLKQMVFRGLNVTEDGAKRSAVVVEKTFLEVEEILGDEPLGLKFLAGDKFSAADIAFCSMASIVVIPKGCKVLDDYFKLEELPPEVVSRVESYRKRKAGQFIQYCYDKHRNTECQVKSSL